MVSGTTDCSLAAVCRCDGNLAHGATDTPGCGAQLVVLPLLVGVSGVGAAPVATLPLRSGSTVSPNGLCTQLAGRRQFGTARARDGALDPRCTAQLVAASLLVAISEVGAARGRPSGRGAAAVARFISFWAPQPLFVSSRSCKSKS